MGEFVSSSGAKCVAKSVLFSEHLEFPCPVRPVMELEVHYISNNIPYLSFILNQLKPTYTTITNFPRAHFNIFKVLPSSIFLRGLYKNFQYVSCFQMLLPILFCVGMFSQKQRD